MQTIKRSGILWQQTNIKINKNLIKHNVSETCDIFLINEKKTALRPILVYMHALVYILKIAVGAPIQNLTYKTLCPYFFSMNLVVTCSERIEFDSEN